jgi:archaemetzincin
VSDSLAASPLEPRLPRRLALAGLAAGALSVHGRAWGAELPEVTLQPLGPGSSALAAYAARALLAFYAVTVRTASETSLPRRAYYPKRARYRAEKLLAHLDETHAGAFRVMGLTATDISTTKGTVEDWGVLGLASMDGRACVLSAFRCRRSARSAAHAVERLGKTAVHELGHTFGLEHCPEKGCLMADGQGTVLTTDGETDLCVECRRKLVARSLLRVDGTPPWPRGAAARNP